VSRSPFAGASQWLASASRAVVRSPQRRRLAGALAAIAGAAVVIGVVLAAELPGASNGASQQVRGAGAASVQRRDLVATDTESGTLGYASPATVFNRLSGTITWLPSIGQVIRPSQKLFEVDGAPVVLFNGTTPAYRDLSSGVTDGPDVQELKQNLIALGFDPNHQIAVNQTFDEATTAAVERWQASQNQPQTGTVALGQIVFLPGAQRITAVQSALGSTGGASGGDTSAGGAGGAAGGSEASGSNGSASGGSASGSAASGGTGSSAGAPSSAGSSSGSGSSGSAPTSTASGASAPVAPAAPEFVSLTTTPPAAVDPRARPRPGGGKGGSGTGHPGSSGAGTPVGNPGILAALEALLKAETAELRAGRSSSAAPSGRSAPSAPSSSAQRPTTSTPSRSGATPSGGGSSGGGGSGGGASGAGSGGTSNAQAILQTTSTQEVVTVNLDATKQTEAVVGEPVTVELPAGSTVNGKISNVSPVAQSSSSSSSAAGGASGTPSATIPVTIRLTSHRHVTGLDQAAVSVNFEQQTARNVLSVPVTALLATPGGGYAVQDAAPPHRLLPVTPGLFAAGLVQVAGPDIYDGLQVTNSQG